MASDAEKARIQSPHGTAPYPDVPPRYKRTEVGVIPEDWDAVRIRDLASVLRGASPRPIDSPVWFDEYSNIGWLRISDVTAAGKYLYGTSQQLSSAGIANSRLVKRGNLVMSICATVGRPIILKKDVCIHDGFVVFEGLKADIQYVYYVLCNIESEWPKHGQTGSQMNLNTHLIESTLISLPQSRSEQRIIAEVLSDVDGLIGALDKLIAKKRAIKQAAMQQLLTGKTRLPGFSGEWETKRLGDIVSFHKGVGLAKSDLSPDGPKRCIHYGELFTTYKERLEKVVSRTNREGNFFLSSRNDVLMPTSDVTPNGLATASCITVDSVILGGDILVIRAPDNELNGEFFAYAVKVYRNKIMQLISGTTVFHLYGRDMANFVFPAPSIAEQQAIATVLSDMDAEIEALEHRRDKTKQIKQGMMQQLLTGRVRLVQTEVN